MPTPRLSSRVTGDTLGPQQRSNLIGKRDPLATRSEHMFDLGSMGRHRLGLLGHLLGIGLLTGLEGLPFRIELPQQFLPSSLKLTRLTPQVCRLLVQFQLRFSKLPPLGIQTGEDPPATSLRWDVPSTETRKIPVPSTDELATATVAPSGESAACRTPVERVKMFSQVRGSSAPC